jgi:hypothetical protein
MEETKNKTKQKTVFICLSVQEGKMWIKTEGYSTVFVSLFQKNVTIFFFLLFVHVVSATKLKLRA